MIPKYLVFVTPDPVVIVCHQSLSAPSSVKSADMNESSQNDIARLSAAAAAE
jgi:hypothetical protein